jgi:hypothetical protein
VGSDEADDHHVSDEVRDDLGPKAEAPGAIFGHTNAEHHARGN